MQNQIQEDLKAAQLAKDEVKVSTLRMLLSEIHNLEIQKGELKEEDITSVISREVKKRKEASEAFRNGNREEQAQKEEAELAILRAYLPEQLSDEELTKLVEDSINEVGASQLSDMGKVIGAVMGKAAGKVDGSRVSSIVREKLNG
jgi:uncharacterized protein